MFIRERETDIESPYIVQNSHRDVGEEMCVNYIDRPPQARVNKHFFLLRRYYKVVAIWTTILISFERRFGLFFMPSSRRQIIPGSPHYRGPFPRSRKPISGPSDSAYKYYFSVMVTFAHRGTRANGLPPFRTRYFFTQAKTFNSTY